MTMHDLNKCLYVRTVFMYMYISNLPVHVHVCNLYLKFNHDSINVYVQKCMYKNVWTFQHGQPVAFV